MTERIIIAGAGGQGIMLLGKILAEAGMLVKKNVTWFPCYGAEVRGGTAYCMVVLSDSEIGSPYVERADTLFIMNSPSLNKFRNKIKKGGLMIINSSLAKRYSTKGIKLAQHPFTEIAQRIGNIKVANMVALGCFLAHKNIFAPNDIVKAIYSLTPENKKGLIRINKVALEEGVRLR